MVETFLKIYTGYPNTNGWLVTFETASKDKNESMSHSQRHVINFDQVAIRHNKLRGYSQRLASNDALYVTEQGEFYFIEFKNGSLTKSKHDKNRDSNKEENLKSKVYCSLTIAQDLQIAESFDSFKQKFKYILVYNKDKLGANSNIIIDDDIQKLSKKTHKLDVVKEFDWIFKETFSYSQEEFEKLFIQQVVEKEYATV